MYFALDRGLSVQELSKAIGSGGYLLETVPNALFLFVRYLNDPQRGIIEAVNFTKDNDTIASIIASAFGGRTFIGFHGISYQPSSSFPLSGSPCLGELFEQVILLSINLKVLECQDTLDELTKVS